MAVSPFVGVQWQPLDLLDQSKMDAMANGIQYVHDNTPRARVGVGSGAARDQQVKIAAGRVQIPRNTKKDSHTEPVWFGNFFSSGCAPLVTLGVQSKMQNNIYAVFEGIDKQAPDQRGMRITIEIGETAGKANEKDKIRRSFQVHWIAMGW